MKEKSVFYIKGTSILSIPVERWVVIHTEKTEFEGKLLYRSPRVTWIQLSPWREKETILKIPTKDIIEAWDTTGWIACA